MDRHAEAVLEEIARRLKPEMSILFVTGAGLSADSGLPTYRGIGGLYDECDTPDGLPIEAVLSGSMFQARPEVTWTYLLEIERASRGATFNPGHKVIAEMERHFQRVWTLTQNVDGLHRGAGTSNLIEIHGDLHDLICTRCDYYESVADYSALSDLPLCPSCQAILRPDVVLFGEMLPTDKLATLRAELAHGFDLIIAVGTSALFPYIQEPVYLARAQGIPTFEINPGETELSSIVDYKVSARAAEALTRLWEKVQKR